METDAWVFVLDSMVKVTIPVYQTFLIVLDKVTASFGVDTHSDATGEESVLEGCVIVGEFGESDDWRVVVVLFIELIWDNVDGDVFLFYFVDGGVAGFDKDSDEDIVVRSEFELSS
jgi:hypothetical protein